MGKLAAPVRADKEMMFTNRQLVALMWPLLLEQLLAITVGLADSLMVATVGDAAISAVSLVDSISNLMIYIFSAMATGGAAVAGQYIGQRQKEDACNAGQQLIALLGAVSIFFVALLYLFRTQILTVMFGHIEPDEHLLFICDGIHSGHRALQRRRGAVPHDGPQRRVAQGLAPDEQYQRDRQRRFDLWLRYGRRGRRDPDARVPHGRGSRHPLAALQPRSDAAFVSICA